MKTLVLHSAFFALIGLILSPPTVVYASSSPAERGPLCPPFDSEQWQRDRLRPAGKRLAGLNVGEPRTVRLIYFLPKDRTPQQDIDAKMDELIKNVQLSYEEVMEYHGFGARTFALETDATGKAVVHHVKGKFNDEYYHTDTFRKVIDEETAERFDPSRNIYIVVLEVSTEDIDGYCGQGGSRGPEGGVALIPAPDSGCFSVAVAAHEIGHAFGLAHDHFRGAVRSPSSYHWDWMITSFCAAEWLDVHRYFNIDKNYPERGGRTTIQMLPPLAVPPSAVRLRFEVTDPDGLHQAQLHNSNGEAIDCQGISSESATVEFVTPEVTEAPGNQVMLRVVDVYGNVTEQWQPIDITALLPPEVVSIPDANLAAVVREALDLTPGDAISQLDMLRLGELKAVRRQIADLTGLEHAVNLKGLALDGNQIRDITPLEGLTILEWLDLPDNNISDISSSAGMTNLSSLKLSGNSVSDLSPLAGLINMSFLYFSGNSVSDLSPLVRLPHLIVLYFSGNSVSDLSPLAGLPLLERLDFSGNSVSDISSLAAMTHLTFLHLDDNSVSDLSPLTESINLHELNLGDNSVSDISSLAAMTHLTFLHLDDNSVSDLSPLTESINLHELNLGDNSVSDLSPLAGLIHLEWLELYSNNISDISSLAAMTHLTFLHLGDNSVSDLSPLERLTNLDGLDLWYNSVSDLSPLAELNGLTFLQIDGNLVSDLSPLVANTGLGDGDVVYVQDNPLSYASIHTHIPILLERGVEVNHDNRAHPALLKISGYNQQGASGVPLAQPFVVAVQDENGSALEGVSVTFTVTEGGGTLSSTTSTTDANGQAATTLTLGSQPGTNTVAATVEGLEPETFTAIGRATTESDGEEATANEASGEDDGEIADDESSGEDQPESEEQPTSTVALEGISASHDSVREDDGQATTITLTVTLDKAATADETITLAIISPTQGKTAKRNEDFDATLDETITITKGQRAGTAQLTLTPKDNTTADGDKAFAVQATSSSGHAALINIKIIDNDSAVEPQAWLMPDPSEVEFYADDPAWKTFTVHTNLDSVLVRANPSGTDPAIEVAGGQQVPSRAYCPAEGNDRPTRGRRDGWSLHVKACQVGRTKILLIDYDTDAVLQQYEINVEAYTSASATTALNPSYPNPFNSETVLSYTLPTASDIRLEVFTLNGQRVAVLHEGLQAAGYHTIAMDASDWASGVYLYRLTTPEGRFAQKFTLLR